MEPGGRITDELIEQIAARTAQILRRELLGITAGAGSYLDVSGAACFLACPKSRIYSLVSARRIPHYRDGSRLLFDRDELRKFVHDGGAVRP